MTDTQLIPLENVSANELFGVKSEAMTGLVVSIKKEAKTLVKDLDISKSKDRKELASVAYKVARSKTTIDDAGKEFAAKLKAQVKVIDGRRREARDQLDALRDEIRGPLDRWEENEQARIDGLTDAIADMRSIGNATMEKQLEYSVTFMEENRQRVEAVDPSEFAEFEENCSETRLATLAKIDTAIAMAKQREAEQAELERLRKEKADREAKEAEERRQREQAEREEEIRREAAEKVAREKEEELRKEREAREQAERDRQAADERAERAKQEAEEQQRREAEAKAEEERKRLRNTQHKGNVNREAAHAIEKIANCSTVTAKKIVKAIVEGKIPNVTINY